MSEEVAGGVCPNNPLVQRAGEPQAEDDDVLVLEETVETQEGAKFYCILGKVLGMKHLNPQAFVSVMRKLWNPLKVGNVRGIASKVGRFIGFDEKGELGWGKFVRARVALNMEKPLRKSLTIRRGAGLSSEVYYRYEGILNFCYLCGRLGHSLKECEKRSEELDEEEILSYGEWLRASPLKPYSAKMASIQVPTSCGNPESIVGNSQAVTPQHVVRKL
ncbi:hypothetical protein Tsubulata_027558 [Turnera subulata]|uniref:CCHC-type domain-containing protein n=1 Tax=Turnera subulata TaxID=218843 RepID=A0A9Q0J475_9ROSI|nr:hypothetical protein Tsubulata_027558 [Turnera subulata]